MNDYKKSTDELDFKGKNPGAVQHGNFINYYQFHPPEKRLKSLPLDVWDSTRSIIALDIGCNAGDLTISLHEYLTKNVCENCEILGVDIDPILIRRANEKRAPQIRFEHLDFIRDDDRRRLFESYLGRFGADKFDVTFCFSVTMWIHLNNGDDGLTAFLKEICRTSKMLVIEPQPWKCYKSALKRLKTCGGEFSKFDELKMRDVERDVEDVILKQGFFKAKESERCEWGRKLYFFKEKPR